MTDRPPADWGALIGALWSFAKPVLAIMAAVGLVLLLGRACVELGPAEPDDDYPMRAGEVLAVDRQSRDA